MRPEHVRNIAAVLVVAAVVAFVPQGGESATFVGSVLGIAFTVLIMLLGMRLYQMFRTDIYGLGDRWRGVLYGSIGAFVLAMAARPKLVDTAGGTLAFIAILCAVLAGLYGVWQRYRAYRI